MAYANARAPVAQPLRGLEREGVKRNLTEWRVPMHHDSRIYVEVRFDGDTADVVVVNFRDRGIVPTEVKTWEDTIDSPELAYDHAQESRVALARLLKTTDSDG